MTDPVTAQVVKFPGCPPEGTCPRCERPIRGYEYDNPDQPLGWMDHIQPRRWSYGLRLWPCGHHVDKIVLTEPVSQ